jgi:hypothetical protein
MSPARTRRVSRVVPGLVFAVSRLTLTGLRSGRPRLRLTITTAPGDPTINTLNRRPRAACHSPPTRPDSPNRC